MGAVCCCFEPGKGRENDAAQPFENKKRSSYQPPQLTGIGKDDAVRSADIVLAENTFVRLDSFLKQANRRPHDLFSDSDTTRRDGSRTVSAQQFFAALDSVGFEMTATEKLAVQSWIGELEDQQVSFKDFALALKKRSTQSPRKSPVKPPHPAVV